MLQPERLREVNLFVLEHDVEAVTDVLLRSEALHLEDVENDALTPRRHWAELARRAEALAERASRALELLGLEPHVGPPAGAVRPAEELDALEAELALAEIRTGDWQARAERNQRALQSLALTRSQLELLEPLGVAVESLGAFRHHHLVLGTMPAENVSRAAAALFMIAFVLVPIRVRGGRALVVAASARHDADVLDRALRSAFFEPAPLPPDARGRPREALAAVERRTAEALERSAELEAERARLAGALRDSLVRLESQLRGAATLADAVRRFPSRGEVFMIAGWVPQRDFDRVAVDLRAAASAPLVLQSAAPARGRHGVPTLLRAPPWLRPFQILVTTYGLAGYGEIDPTLPAAVTFLLMYGMMFGDVGHGLLLAAAGLVLGARTRTPLARVVTAAGLSGVLFGVLYGTVFGAPCLPSLWLRPLERVQDVLLISVAGGVTVLNLAFALNLVTRLRERDWGGLLLERNGVVGVVFYWVLLGGGALAVFGRLDVRIVLAALALPAALLWLREPLQEWLAGRRPSASGDVLVTGFFELFESVLGYASNSLSFVRLGAFAVAHEGLSAMVLRYAHGPAGWLELALGTALIVGFEGLVVGIQALRLEYFEFFGRFFRGNGVPFVPLSFQGGSHARLQV